MARAVQAARADPAGVRVAPAGDQVVPAGPEEDRVARAEARAVPVGTSDPAVRACACGLPVINN